MTKYIIILITALLYLNVHGQDYAADVNMSNLKWKGYSEVGSYSQEGTITLKTANLKVNNGNIHSCEMVIDTKTISSIEKDLEKHLKQKDFFWVKKYPLANFSLIEIKDGIAEGTLVIRGKSSMIKFPYSIKKVKDKLILIGKMTIDRTQYDIKYNSSSYFQNLGNYAIKNEFDLEFRIVFNPK